MVMVMAIPKSFQFQVVTRRLLWVIGTIFALVVAIQHFELPYSDVLSSLLNNGEIPTSDKSKLGTGDSSSESQMGHNLTQSNTFQQSINSTGTSEENSRSPNNKFVSDTETDMDMSSVANPTRSVGSAPVEARKPEQTLSNDYVTEDYNSSKSNIQGEHMPLPSETNGSLNTGLTSPVPYIPPITLPPKLSLPINTITDTGTPMITVEQNTSSGSANEKEVETLSKNEKPGPALRTQNPPIPSVPAVKEKSEMPMSAVVSISEMKKVLHRRRASYHSVKPRWSLAVDQELFHAKSQVENAPIITDPRLYAPLYRNVSMFRRSYELMEQILRIYIYREGERPVFHRPPLKGIYASEGWFMKLLEANKNFVSKDPKKAHLFYLPFSSRQLEETLYVPNSHVHKNLIQYLKNYLDLIMVKYPFWNRTGGADHFLVACHDWAPAETRVIMSKCIRALCNSDVKEGFQFGKDVSLPETYVRSPQSLLRDVGGKPHSKRNILAFFAGRMHGYLRPILLQHWENKDPDMKIYGQLPKAKGKMSYIQHMKSSKYCICAKGYEVNSPRVVEAIFYECVPVIISDNFVPPFFEILNWESFAIFVPEKDIPNLKNILLSISRKRYLQLQRQVKKVQQHFLWHAKPEKYDMFHMILHSVWYNRVLAISLM